MHIPLPKMMRHYREQEYERKLAPQAVRAGLAAWAFLAKRPALYHFLSRAASSLLGLLGRRQGSFYNLPLAGGWTGTREMPAPQGRTFQAMWRQRRQRKDA